MSNSQDERNAFIAKHKPLHCKLKIALMKSGLGYKTVQCYSPMGKIALEQDIEFVKWITDWIEYTIL